MSVRPRPSCCLVILAAALSAQQFGGLPQGPEGDLLRQGQQKLRDGNPEEALALYKQAVEKYPNSVAANNQTGVLLDLMGQYSDARKYFQKAIDSAATPQAKGQAMRQMAMSYAFENNCKQAEKYESQLYQTALDAQDFFNAGEAANELARVCIEAGDLDTASKWYKTGHDAGMKDKADQKDLWDFRWEHALGRIAARRGNKAEAQKHVAAAKAILDRGLQGQTQFFPYLTGYVAFYAGDYKTAVADFQKANQDPFIWCMIAQSYEKLGDKAQAMEYYRKAAGSNAHNPPNAFAHPFAKKKLSSS
jgi:tetratricopeptide (TPR) repeat protein